jgi:hypothetical protein
VTLWTALSALFIQPEFGIPLLLLIASIVVWWSWESQLLPPRPAPYAIRPYWTLDSVRLLHEALNAGELGATIQATYTWLSREFLRRYGVHVSRYVSLRGYSLRRRIPHRSEFVRVVRGLQSAFLDALYAENTKAESWFAGWRRPRARARAQRNFLRALAGLEGLQTLLGPPVRGAVA